jgi:hypothetical protein
MKTVDKLVPFKDYIAFAFNYLAEGSKEIIVDNVTRIDGDDIYVHFLYGYRSLCEVVKKKDVLAIGNNETGEGKIPGWSGNYDILNQKVIDEILEKRKALFKR